MCQKTLWFFCDEAHFHLSGCVNHQNFRYWSRQNPRELHEIPLHNDRVTVWCAIARVGILGPYFFEDDGATVTVNSQRYTFMINNFLAPRLNALQIDQNIGGVIVRGRRIKCIGFADYIALLEEEEMILRDILLDLNGSYERYGMKINEECKRANSKGDSRASEQLQILGLYYKQ
ncbi:hypothetical protein ANN_00489 [Periplaneta americana]|uniref:Uncharacterized protein n=1 Tax=Periplaneta americana TaxID=6978 RepID=A0ABQ8TQY0_PERAM|nr:hypothetical protein ANN_00489 [Periplaneta americana]